jgi:ATP adenylyltransferase
MAYIDDANRKKGDECILCGLAGGDPTDDASRYILARGKLNFVMLNAFPYNPGHLMITPYRHLGDVTDLAADELAEMMALLQRGIRALRETSAPHGFNIGMNLGRIAGAGIADHVHLHVVPRWGGDTNFMPVVGETKVLPEMLEGTYDKLAPLFA